MSEKTMKSKQRILKSAKKLFASRGYKSTTIRDIANDVNLNSSLISYHFDGKEGLLKELISELYDSELPALSEVISRPVSNKDEFLVRLEIFMESNIKVGIKNWELVQIITNETYELSKIDGFNAANISSLQAFASFIESAQRVDVIRKEISCLRLADSIYALLVDQIKFWKLNKEHMNHDISKQDVRSKWITETLDIFIYGSIVR
ncbi:MAG: hypothetical protein BM556_01715 [Bacteriovorax sp. MedPE-SWde]|nr:MAG: hypothetical protein BM556_01715 [Bacteriovorax sp. MedPE-SWde]